MNHEMASKYIYIAGAQHNVTLSDNGRTRNWTTATEKKKRKRSEHFTVIPTAMDLQFTLRRLSFVHISSNDMVCQQITVQTVKAYM